MASVSRFLTKKLRLKVNEAKSAVAQPEERKFLGFSISNDGSERRIAPQALDKFQARIRDMTRRTRGISLAQLIKELKPYLIGWRGYFGFCQTPWVLTNCEAWIRRRLRSYLWRQWGNGTTASRSCAVVAYQNSGPRLPPVRRRGSGACQDIRRSNRPCAISTSTRSVFPDSMSLSKRNPVEPPWYVTRMPGGVGGAAP
ncbi:group II intron maturase-specific domain-containing protein [Ancylobacter sp. IITR112]|uniref:group II intron maturase-specific domain-containing protein n=1 Tax=Ancylobacter sp. IITR112 TaxID=3138073 RepID=UPI00352B6DE4